jgi:cholest-4-en-3-one 26-monooxygenase
MGIPRSEETYIFDRTNVILGESDPEYVADQSGRGRGTAVNQAGQDLIDLVSGLAEERQRQPRRDLITELVSANVDGEQLTPQELGSFFILLVVAGNETTRNAIAHSMLALIEHPDQRQKLLDDPSKIDSAIEEFLRWSSPVMCFRRTTTCDTVLGGQEIKAGERVVMWHMSGNRDETIFDDPYTFDIDRDPNLHLMQIAFGGGGPHFCLGANLARAEMKIMFEELLPVLPDMELNGEVARLRSNFINGIKHLPVSYTPKAYTPEPVA